MNHRVFWSLSALVASVTLQAQGYLESERWVGWIQPSTEVYVDEDTRRMLLVDRQLDYVQLRYSAQGSGLKPTQIQRIPLSKWGSATVLGFSRGEVVVDSSSRSGGTVYRFGLDSSFKAELLAPVFQDSLRVLGSQLLDIDRRAVGASIASKKWMDGQLRLQNQIVLADSLRPEWLSYQAGRWIAIWKPEGKAPVLSFLSSNGAWNEFPYPINQDGMNPRQMSILDNDSLLVVGTKGDSAVFNFMRLRKAPVNTTGDRVQLGEFSLFYETTKTEAPAAVTPALNPGESSKSVIPNQNSVGGERSKKKGRFAVMFDTFKNADDAYSLLNGLMGKFPDAYAVDTKEGIAVMGPNRISLAQIQADSSRAFSSGIGVKKLVTYADKLKERKETLVTLQVYDAAAKNSVPFTLVFFNRGTDRIIFSDTVRTGRINFIYSHGAELGVAVSSPGYFPQSIRLNPAMAPVATHYYHDMFLKPTKARDPLNPNRSIVQSADLDFQNILFGFNEDVPRRISAVEINAMKHAFSGLDSVVLVLEGHTDDVGSDTYNWELGRRRANAVAKELRSVLRPTAELSSVSLGESKPVALNDNDFHRSLNRRVTLRVQGMPSSAAPRSAAPPVQEVSPAVPAVPEPASDSAYTGQAMPQEVAEVVEQAPAEVEIPILIAPKADKKERAKADKAADRAANEADRQAKDAARLKAKQDAAAAKSKAEADKVAQREKEAQAKAAEEARMRRIMDVAAQNKAADEAKQADAKAAAQAASDEAKKSSKPDKKPKDAKGKGGV
jgi:outer membrane protein OmpA-like peptidoglycan-associated protein